MSANPSVSDICLVPFLLNRTKKLVVCFHLNDASLKLSRVLNLKRNTRFLGDIAKPHNIVLSDYFFLQINAFQFIEQ
jgi:hypothetical protein